MYVVTQFLWILAVFILFKCRCSLKYYFKFATYYVALMFLSLLMTPYFALNPKNVRNSLVFAELIKNVTKVLGVKWTLKGAENLSPNKSFIIVANHQSSLDVMGMFNIWHTIQSMTAIGKKSLMYTPGFGLGAYLAGIIFIDRSGIEAKSAISNAMQTLKRNNIKLWIFPEGTRRNTGMIHDFKKGAFHTAIEGGIPIVPVVFSSYKHFLDRDKKIFDSGEIIIKALPEVSTKGLNHSDIDALIQRIKNDMTRVYEETSKEIKRDQNIFNIFYE